MQPALTRAAGARCNRIRRTPLQPLNYTGGKRGHVVTKAFADRIALMNAMYKLPAHAAPTIPPELPDRLRKFKATLLEEIHEIDEIVASAEQDAEPLDLAVAIADLLGDIIVYCRSESLKYGLPLEEVLDIIMDSNESKLGADGQPIYNENGKFLKGPNYWRPESKIRQLLQRRGVA
jgi:hypothetical protein